MSYTLRMKELRKLKKLTQSQLASMIGETDRVVGAWERGETALPLDSAYKIALALECSVNDLCGWPKGKNEGREFEDDSEAELLGCYRASTPQWRQNISMTARAAAGESKETAERSVSDAKEMTA
mgnify:CR=1 FL=1